VVQWILGLGDHNSVKKSVGKYTSALGQVLCGFASLQKAVVFFAREMAQSLIGLLMLIRPIGPL